MHTQVTYNSAWCYDSLEFHLPPPPHPNPILTHSRVILKSRFDLIITLLKTPKASTVPRVKYKTFESASWAFYNLIPT